MALVYLCLPLSTFVPVGRVGPPEGVVWRPLTHFPSSSYDDEPTHFPAVTGQSNSLRSDRHRLVHVARVRPDRRPALRRVRAVNPPRRSRVRDAVLHHSRDAVELRPGVLVAQ